MVHPLCRIRVRGESLISVVALRKLCTTKTVVVTDVVPEEKFRYCNHTAVTSPRAMRALSFSLVLTAAVLAVVGWRQSGAEVRSHRAVVLEGKAGG